MQTTGQGRLLSKRFGIENPPTLVADLSVAHPVTFSHLRFDSTGLTLGSIPPEPAYSIHLHLRDACSHIRTEGRSFRKTDIKAGTLCFFDLQSPPDILFDSPMRTIRSHVPIGALQAFAEGASIHRVSLQPPQSGADDPVIRYLLASLGPILEHPEDGNSLFIDHIALALQAYLLRSYGTSGNVARLDHYGLAPWQERLAKEVMDANLHKDISIAELACEVGLSSSHFARAFRQATGRPPHRWLLERRVEIAQGMLLKSAMSLPEIAAACGFSDQSAFTRSFTQLVGTSPDAWRRLHRT